MNAELEARASLYAALAHAFAYPHSFDALTQIAAELDEARDSLPAALRQPFSAAGRLYAALHEARGGAISPAEEHTHLFARQAMCPPYESAYVPSGMERNLADIAGFYRAFGLQMAPDAHERADHIGTQLEFMAVLCAKESYAQQYGVLEQVEICRDARRSFLSQHLGRWAAAFAARLRATARLDFYPALGETLTALLKFEARELDVALAPESEFIVESAAVPDGPCES